MMVLGEDTADGWRIYGSFFGHGISSGHGQYRTFKRTYVYYKDNQKTNWFMNTYVAIEFIKVKLIRGFALQSYMYNKHACWLARRILA